MSTKRAAPRGPGGTRGTPSGGPSNRDPAAPQALTPQEENVVRMRRGLAAPDDLVLGRVGQDHPATRAKLLEIEARAFERSGRLDELRKEAGLEIAATDGATKQKIISKLAKKAEPSAQDAAKAQKSGRPAAKAEVTAKAGAKASAKAKPRR